VLATLRLTGTAFPIKYSLNGTIPEFTNIKLGSSLTTIEAEGII
jgi:hypothetical protein